MATEAPEVAFVAECEMTEMCRLACLDQNPLKIAALLTSVSEACARLRSLLCLRLALFRPPRFHGTTAKDSGDKLAETGSAEQFS